MIDCRGRSVQMHELRVVHPNISFFFAPHFANTHVLGHSSGLSSEVLSRVRPAATSTAARSPPDEPAITNPIPAVIRYSGYLPLIFWKETTKASCYDECSLVATAYRIWGMRREEEGQSLSITVSHSDQQSWHKHFLQFGCCRQRHLKGSLVCKRPAGQRNPT